MRRFITPIVTLAAVLALGASPANAETYLTWDGSRGTASAFTGTLVGGPAAVWLTADHAPGVYDLSVRYSSVQAHLSGYSQACLELVGVSGARHCVELKSGGGIGEIRLTGVHLSGGQYTTEVSLTPSGQGQAVVQANALSVVRKG